MKNKLPQPTFSSAISRRAALEDVPNTETLAAMKEAECGHDAGVVRIDSLESFMASMEELIFTIYDTPNFPIS